MTRRSRTIEMWTTVLTMTAGALTLVPTAAAQNAGETILVTAQKRSQDLQDVPLSVGVLQGETLDGISAGGEDILFLSARSPSLYAESSSGRTFPRFYIRGLGNTDFDLNASQPVSLVYDGVVLENPILKGFPVFDLDRIEILRGPQGTLFGRNTPAGTIKFESARPTTTPEGYARVSYGRFNTVDAEAAISGPLAGDALTGRLSVLFQDRDDFVDNTFAGGEDGFEEFSEFAGRAQLLYAPSDDFTALVAIRGRRLDGGSRTFRANVIEPGTDNLIDDFRRDETAQDANQVLEVFSFGTSLTLEYTTGPWQLTSITGYETVGITAQGDVDGGFGAAFAPPSGPGLIPFPAETADNITDHRQLTQEVRLAYDPDPSLHALLGVFVYHEHLEIENLSFDTLAGSVENGRALQNQDTLAWAVFGSASWQPVERVTLSGGVRVSGDLLDFEARRLVSPIGAGALDPLTQDLDDTVVSGDASLRVAVTQWADAYARVARSYRAPNAQGRILFGDVVTVADTETIVSYEAGVKAQILKGRGRIALSGFYYETDNQQLTAVGGAGNFNQLLNADQVIGYGFELETAFTPTEHLTLTAGMSLNETEIRDRDLQVAVCAAPCTVLNRQDPVTGLAFIDGNALPQAPRFIANATMRYGVPVLDGMGEVFVFTDWAYRSRVNFFLYESTEFRDTHLLEGGVRVGYAHDHGRYELAAFGRNITNDVSTEGAIDFNNFSAFVNEPPVWGIEALARF